MMRLLKVCSGLSQLDSLLTPLGAASEGSSANALLLDNLS